MDPQIINSLLPPNIDPTLQFLVLLVILSFIPMLALTTTPFLRIVTVLFLLRGALGVQSSPPNIVITGLSMILTVFVMQADLTAINEHAVIPLSKKQITLVDAMNISSVYLQRRMLKQVDMRDIDTVYRLTETTPPKSAKNIDFIHLVAAHIMTELRVSFSLGFLIYIPFLVVDLIVANILLALGMMMLSPTIISLPFKLMIFVAVDGWTIIIRGLVDSFR